MHAKLLQLCLTLCSPKDCKEYWSGFPFPPPGDLPDPGIKPTPLTSPKFAGIFLNTCAPEKLKMAY